MFLALLIILLFFVVIISIITFIHELGHFLVAKYNGVRVAEFAIGFGPKIFSFKKGETTYSFRLFPFGGYVSVLSDEVLVEIKKLKEANPNLTPEQKHSIEKRMGGLTIDEDYTNQKTIEKISSPRKALFSLGGVIFNLISIFVMLFVLNFSYGREVKQDSLFYYANYSYGTESDYSYRSTSVVVDELNYFTNYDETSNIAEMTTVDGYKDMRNFLNSEMSSSYEMSLNDIIDYGLITSSSLVLNRFFWSNNDNTNSDFQNNKISSLTSSQQENLKFKISYSDVSIGDSSNSNEQPQTLFIQTNSDNLNVEQARISFISDIYYEYDDDQDSSTPNQKEDVLFFIGKSSYSNNNIYYNLSDNKVSTFVTYPGSLSAPIEYFSSTTNYVEYSKYYKLNWYESIGWAFVDTFKDLGYSVLWLLNVLSFNTLLPAIGAHQSSDVIEYNDFWYIYKNIVEMLILFSALVIIFNIIPVPPLDGWRFVEYSYEGIKKKKIKDSTAKTVSRVGWGLMLIYFFVFLFFI